MPLALEIVPGKAIVVRREKTVVAASWFGPGVLRPFIHPFLGPSGVELTRLGHPGDPVGHSHHRSIWIGHRDVSGSSFWEENADSGRIEQVEASPGTREGPEVSVSCENVWKTAEGRPLLLETRKLAFADLDGGNLGLEISIELRPAEREGKVALGDTPFGLLGIRVARTASVAEKLGGGILNSQEAENEPGCHWQHADWCDYSGPFPVPGPRPAGAEGLPWIQAGIACFDHPDNSPEDTIWHVRDDGWMGPCISKGLPRTIESAKPLGARYRLETHTGGPADAAIAERYRRWRSGAR
jgi:hypothetical protein